MKTVHRLAAQAKHRQFIQIQNHPVDLMSAVKRRVATLNTAQQSELLAPYREAAQALQFGQFSETHFRMLADCFNVAEALAKPPFNLANDHADKFRAALAVLCDLADQYSDCKSWTPRAAQLQTVKDALEIHEIQLEHVAQVELLDAAARVVRRARGALAGSGGCTVVDLQGSDVYVKTTSSAMNTCAGSY